MFLCDECSAPQPATPESAFEVAGGKEATGFDALAEMAEGTSFGALFDATKDVASLQAQCEQLKRERDSLLISEDSAYRRMQETTAKVNQLQADVLRLEKEKIDLSKTGSLNHAQHCDEVAELSADLAAARKELEKVPIFSFATDRIAALESRLAQAEVENEELRTRLGELGEQP